MLMHEILMLVCQGLVFSLETCSFKFLNVTCLREARVCFFLWFHERAYVYFYLGVAKDTRFNPLHVPSKVRSMSRCITEHSHIHHYPGTNVGTSISK